MSRVRGPLLALVLISPWAADGPTWNGQPVGAWAEQLRNGDSATSADAARRLGQSGWPGAVPLLIEYAEPRPSWRVWRVALRRLGPTAEAAVQARIRTLIGMLDTWEASEACQRLAAWEEEARAAAPHLLRRFETEAGRTQRAELLTTLGQIAPDNPATRALLRSALRDPEENVRGAAARAWGRQDPRRLLDPAFVAGLGDPALSATVADCLSLVPSPQAAAAVMAAFLPALVAGEATDDGLGDFLGRLGEPPVPGLHRDPEAVAYRRMEVWGREADPAFVRAAVPYLLRYAAHPDAGVRSYVVGVLARLTPRQPEAVEVLAARLADPQKAVRDHALEALLAAGPAAEPAVPAVLRLLAAGTDISRHWGLLGVLENVGPAAREAVPLLVTQGRQSPAICAQALARIDPAAARALVPLLAQAVFGDGPGAFAALNALRDLGPTAAEAVPALAALLQTTAADQRRQILETLAAIGPAAGSAAGQLPPLLGDPRVTAQDRQLVVTVLARVGPPAVAVPVLQRVLTGPDPFLALVAAAGLDRLRPEAPLPGPPWQALVAAAVRHDHLTRPPPPAFRLPMTGCHPRGKPVTGLFKAVVAAHALHPAADRHLAPILVGSLGRPAQEDWELWEDAARVASRFGPAVKAVALPLAPRLVNYCGPIARQEWADLDEAKALVAMGPETALPALIACLGDPHWAAGAGPVTFSLFGDAAVPPLRPLLEDEERCSAATALGYLGEVARPAVPALVALTRHADVAVRRAAVTALMRIDPAALPPLP